MLRSTTKAWPIDEHETALAGPSKRIQTVVTRPLITTFIEKSNDSCHAAVGVHKFSGSLSTMLDISQLSADTNTV